MSLTTEGMTPADIYACTRNNDGNGGFGGNEGWWILLLLLFAGGWGNGFGGGNGGGNLYPWMNQANLTSEGFQNQMLNDNVTSIRDGIASLSTQLCNCCGDMQMAVANGFAGVEMGANARQMANMNQMFANQTAMMQGFNNVQSQFAECLKKILNKAKEIFGFARMETVGTYA